MMTFSILRNQGQYYLDIARDDYYLNGGEPDGVWTGIGSMILGLHGAVQPLQFKYLLKGLNPQGDKALCQSSGNHTPGWDLTFNAPKSVSVIWAAANPLIRQEIQAAQNLAVRQAISLLEENASFTRRGKAGNLREKVTGLVVAMFEHSTSREIDPHLHTHAVVANVAPRSDDSWGTLESRSIMLWQKAAGMAYKLSLAESLRSLGFKTSMDGDSFKVDGVPQAVCKEFSKRSQQIVDALGERGIKKRVSAAGDVAALNTRAKKGGINRRKLLSEWQKRLSLHGINAQTVARMKQYVPHLLEEPLDTELMEKVLTESNSVFSLQDVYFYGGLKALASGQTLSSLQSIATDLCSGQTVVDLGENWRHSQLYTTRDVLEREQLLISHAKVLCSASWSNVPQQVVNAAIRQQPIKLSDEQQFAVRNVCTEAQLAIVQGSAGAGKSASMSCVRDIYSSLGKKVVGAAIARSAAKNLEVEAGIKSFTIARFLGCLHSGHSPLSNGDVLVIDEAGQVGTFELEQLMTHAIEKNFKIVLVGEDKQLDAVEHGGVLRYISSPEIVGTTRIETIRRQNEEWDRYAVAAFRDGYANQALAQYQKRDQLHIVKGAQETKNALIDAWTLYRQQFPNNQSVVLAHGWNDVIELNNAMRSQLQLENRLGNENLPLKGTVSDRDVDLLLSVGERVRFTKNDYRRNYTNGDLGTVIGLKVMDDGDVSIAIQLDSGRKTQLSASSYANEQGRVHITQAYAQTVYSSQGTTVNGNVFVYYTSNMDRANSYVACSRHKIAAHIFANELELEQYIPTDFEHAPRSTALREALARCMSRDLRPKLASEYLVQDTIRKNKSIESAMTL